MNCKKHKKELTYCIDCMTRESKAAWDQGANKKAKEIFEDCKKQIKKKLKVGYIESLTLGWVTEMEKEHLNTKNTEGG